MSEKIYTEEDLKRKLHSQLVKIKDRYTARNIFMQEPDINFFISLHAAEKTIGDRRLTMHHFTVLLICIQAMKHDYLGYIELDEIWIATQFKEKKQARNLANYLVKYEYLERVARDKYTPTRRGRRLYKSFKSFWGEHFNAMYKESLIHFRNETMGMDGTEPEGK